MRAEKNYINKKKKLQQTRNERLFGVSHVCQPDDCLFTCLKWCRHFKLKKSANDRNIRSQFSAYRHIYNAWNDKERRDEKTQQQKKKKLDQMSQNDRACETII